MSARFTKTIVIPDTVLFQEIEGEAVLLRFDSDSYFGLNEVGARMWQVASSTASLQEAYEVLLGEFDVDSEMLADDLDRLMAQLQQAGLLVLRDAS